MIVWLYSTVNPSYHEVKLALRYLTIMILTDRVCTAAASLHKLNQGKQSKLAHVFLTVYFQCVVGE